MEKRYAMSSRRILAYSAALLLVTACSPDPKPSRSQATTVGERWTRLMSATLAASRADALFFEIHGTASKPLDSDGLSDGRTVTLDETANVRAQTAAPDNLDDMLDYIARRLGLPVPIGDSDYSSPCNAFIARETRGGFSGWETGVRCGTS
jgi:hypothetical protein